MSHEPTDEADTLTGQAIASPAVQRFAKSVHAETHPVVAPNEHPASARLHDRRRAEHAQSHATLSSNEALTAQVDLVADCNAHFRDLRFDEGIARARRDAGWASDPHARLHVAIGLFYKREYERARAEYAVAASLSASPSFQGTCVANLGAAWYEEGDFDRAVAEFARALALDPLNEFGLLGLLAVACERRDRPAVLAEAARIRAAWPGWRERNVIAQSLAHDRSYRFVRDAPGLFEEAFGAPLDALYLG